MPQRTVWTMALLTLVVGAVLGAGVAMSVFDGDDGSERDEPLADNPDREPRLQTADPGTMLEDQDAVEQFGTAEAFKEYVRAGQRRQSAAGRIGNGRAVEVTAANRGGNGADSMDAAAPEPELGNAPPDRVAESNVQVQGFDEPDTVKTDGRNFYYSPLGGASLPRRLVMDEDERERHDLPAPRTHVIDVNDPAAPAAITDINTSGKLIQTGETLVVFEERAGQITGYDVSDPAEPSERWSVPLNDSLVTAREAGGQLYVVTQTRVGYETTCPIEPLGGEHAVDCGDVFAPGVQTSADATYTAFSIDAESGTVEDSVSFVGTGDNTVVYMAEGSLYLTYTTGISEAELLASWVAGNDDIPEQVQERISEINAYDISERSKEREMGAAIEQWLGSLPEEERQERSQELRESFESYMADHQKELTQTSVVHVGVEDDELTVGETGTVPGEPLNQFALDEHEGTLRVATTIPRAGGQESTNSLYVLDNETLTREDEVTGMGEDQRVYAVRYVGDTAYMITFRQVDPFYVIDFEEPTDPELLGELKLPGFSTYLHPVDDQTVLGVGREDGQVKAVLFDVTDPTDPEVGDDLLLGERWSAVDESHHAFLMDRRHEVFFLPAGDKGLVVDYTDGELEIVKEVQADSRVTRARYVDDHLYVFAGDEVIVLDQTNWERTTTLELRSDE